MRLLLSALLVILATGCATGVSRPQPAADGTFVVSVSNTRVFGGSLEPIDEALAEARFKCWNDHRSSAVVPQRVEAAGRTAGLSRTATLRFRCAEAVS